MIPRPLDFPFGRPWFADGFETTLFTSSDHSLVMGPSLEWKWRESWSFSYRISFPYQFRVESLAGFVLLGKIAKRMALVDNGSWFISSSIILSVWHKLSLIQENALVNNRQ